MKDTKFCPTCGQEINAAAHKCRHCGHWLEKQCPFCGEWILTEAKKCKHCGKWLEPRESINIAPINSNNAKNNDIVSKSCSKIDDITYTVTKRKWKILRHCSLQEFKYANGNVTITMQNGKTFSAPAEMITTSIHERKGRWRDLSLRYDNQKAGIREYDDLLTKEEWKGIEDILNLGTFDNSNFGGKVDDWMAYIKIIVMLLSCCGFFVWACNN